MVLAHLQVLYVRADSTVQRPSKGEWEMKAVLSCLLFFVALFAVEPVPVGGTSAFAAETAARNSPADSEFLVRFKADTSVSQRRAFADSVKGTLMRRHDRYRVHQLRIGPAEKAPPEGVLVKLRRDPRVEWAEPNYRRSLRAVPNDPMFGSQWHLQNTGQTGGTPGIDVHAVQSWNVTTGDPDVVVAILDSGVDYTHPDLQANMWHNSGEDWAYGVPGHNGVDDDGNGYVDDYYGIDAANDGGDPVDTIGHGTHVAGIVGAVGNNGVGVSGIAWRTRLMALKFLDPEGTVGDELECISYILDQKEKGVAVQVVNASFGDKNFSRFEMEAIESLAAAGIMMTAPAGNDGDLLTAYNLDYPASYAIDNIITVAAIDEDGRLAPFSNYGFHDVDLAAPGAEILSTYLGNGYETLEGTSMAAPMVAGAIALLQSRGEFGLSEVRERILRGVDESAYLHGRVFSQGELNIYRTLTETPRGPYVFGLSPVLGAPGTRVTISGVHFGDGGLADSRVTFGEVDASIVSWRDEEIVCLVPQQADLSADTGTGEVVTVHTRTGVSNEVLFGLAPYRYFLPFAPADAGWVGFLILCNYGNETVNALVYAGPSDAWVIEPRTEVLEPWQLLLRDIRDYGLASGRNILWVESERDIGVDIIILNTGLPGFVMIPAQGR
jgi:subtilisin family serine protease